jgi:aminomethyltransferase
MDKPMNKTRRTILYTSHIALGAQMTAFGGWEMPLQYRDGVLDEHLTTRSRAGLFDVSHMGRFVIRGPSAVPFLQHVLTNNVESLDLRSRGAQYTIMSNERGGAIDDAFLYRFNDREYTLVVNAGNRETDLQYLETHAKEFKNLELLDQTDEIGMMALQGPQSRAILIDLIEAGFLPERRNTVSAVKIAGMDIAIARTGYTGEPLCFELFLDREQMPALWDLLLSNGAAPVGLAARDTLRLEAGLPLFGHELGPDREGTEIPIGASRASRAALSFSPLKDEFVGRAALTEQADALSRILARDYSARNVLPRTIRPTALVGRGVARAGATVCKGGRQVGYVTSGTAVPYWVFEDKGVESRPTAEHKLRSICLAYIDSDLIDGDWITIDIRGKEIDGVVVPYHLRPDASPFSRPITVESLLAEKMYPASTADRNTDSGCRSTTWAVFAQDLMR